MAWGVLMNDLRRNFQNAEWYINLFGVHTEQPPSAESLLFGSLISVSMHDVVVSLVVGAVIIALGIGVRSQRYTDWGGCGEVPEP